MENRSEVLPQSELVLPRTAASASVVSLSRAEQLEYRVRVAFRITAVFLAAVHVWAQRHAMNPDGINYLDMAEAYFRGDWGVAVNAHWSPLYSWLLGLTLVIFRPSPYWEFAAAHLLNLVIFLAALGCFEFLLREVVRLTRSPHKKVIASDGRQHLQPVALMALGYALFIWTALDFITLRLLTPDMLIAATIYLAVGLLLRIRRSVATSRTFIELGAVLGVGFLAKAAMFPLAFILLVLAWFAAGELRKAAPRVLLAAIVFLLISGPFIFALSKSKGRLTFGDSAKLTYAWFVNGLPLRHYQGEKGGYGQPVHPTRKVFNKPVVYEFAGPIGGTNPVWYDPSYWYEGVQPRFAPKEQIKAIGSNVAKYHRMFLSYLQSSLLVGFLILLLYAYRGWRPAARALSDKWTLLIPAIAGLAMFAMVYTEARYVAPFVVLWWLALFAGVRLPNGHESRRLAASVTVVLVAMLMVLISVDTAPKLVATARGVLQGERRSDHEAWWVSASLNEAGIQAGDKVAVIFPEPQKASPSRMISWARLARVKVAAEIPSEHAQDFWAADSHVRSQVMEILAKADVKAVVTEKIPANVSSEGWQRIGKTDYFTYMLPR